MGDNGVAIIATILREKTGKRILCNEGALQAIGG